MDHIISFEGMLFQWHGAIQIFDNEYDNHWMRMYIYSMYNWTISPF